MKVNVGSEYSAERPLDFSVPQGSGTEPSMYFTYASTMKDTEPSGIGIHGYADDHALKIIAVSSKPNETSTIHSLTDVTTVLKIWMDENRLKMNNDQTEFILFRSRQQLRKTHTTSLDVNGVLIDRGDCIKYLGADLDKRLSGLVISHLDCANAVYSGLPSTQIFALYK